MTYIITYDIHDPKRLKEVSKILENVAWRIQESVFQGNFDEKELASAKKFLLASIEPEEDSLLFFPLCKKCLESKIALGLESFTTKGEKLMVL